MQNGVLLQKNLEARKVVFKKKMNKGAQNMELDIFRLNFIKQ